MQESVIYQDIKEQGIKQGLEQGRQEGLQEGRQEGLQEGRQEGLQRQASLVIRQIKRCIGELESEDEARITGLSVEELEALGEALFDFSSRDDLLTWFANN